MPFPKPDTGQLMGMFVVTRSGDLTPTVQVNYQTQDGTGANGAHAGVDYVATSGMLTLAANQTMATISVPIIGNNIFQADKTFTVSLSNPPSSAVDFTPQQTFATGSRPLAVAVGDFNGDGKPDLAIANSSTNTVSVLLNTTPVGATTASFAPQQTFATGTGPVNDVVVGDFNGDGKPDLAVANVNSNTVSVLLNTTAIGATTPSFAPQQTFATGTNPLSVAVGAFNGDGKPDLAIANLNDNTVSVLLNTTAIGATTPTFTPQQTFATGTGPLSVAVGAFNGDGQPDLAVTNGNLFGPGTVSVLLNTTPAGATTPTFAPQQTFAVGTAPESVAVADFNGDGKPDLAVANSNGLGSMSVLLNTTAAGATAPTFAPQQTFAVLGGPFAVAVADLNGDGQPDLAVANANSNTVSVLLNTTALGATTVSFALQQTFATGTVPLSVTVGDFNGDGQPDLAIANWLDATVSVLLNTSVTITGSPATGTISSAPETPTTITVVPGTTPQSALTNRAFATPLAVDVRDASGTLIQGVTVTFTAPASGASGTFGGFASVMAVTNASGRATARTFTANTRTGTYAVTAQAAGASNPSTSFDLTNFPRFFAVGGAPGLVQIRRDDDGSLITEFAPYGPGYTGPISVAVGDVSGDGIPDLVTAAAAGNPDVRVFDGMALENGSFNPANPSASLLAQWFAYGLNFNVGATVAVGDIENDGFADIVTGATAGNPQVKVYRGKDIASHTFDPNGGSVLASFFGYGLNFNIGANVAVGDISHNGYADVVTGASAGNPQVKVYNGKDIALHTFDPNGSSVLAQWFAFGLQANIGATVAVGEGVNYRPPGSLIATVPVNYVIVGASSGNPQVKIYNGDAIANGMFNSAMPDSSLRGEFFAYNRLNANVGVNVSTADFEGTGVVDILTGPTQGSANFRVVRADTATGIMPAAINGIDLVASDLTDGVSVGA
jgi:hypothetical protein